MARTPVPQAPIRRNLNDLDPEFQMAPEWVRWFNQVTSFSVELEEYKATLDPSSVSANTTEEQSFTLSNVNANDLILAVNKPSHTTGLGIVNFRAGTDQIHITFMNTTGSSIDPPSEDYLILVLKRE